MGLLLDLAVILGIVYLVASAAARGAVSSPLAAVAVVALLIGGVLLRAAARVAGSVLRGLFTVGMPLVSFYFLVNRHAGEGERFTVAAMLFTLFLVLVGIYVIGFGAFSSPRGILWNLPALLSIMVFVVGQAARGYMPPETAAILMVALVLLRGAGSLLGPRVARTTRAAYSLFIPLAGLVLLVWLTLGLEQGLPFELAVGHIGLLAGLAIILYLSTRAFLGG